LAVEWLTERLKACDDPALPVQLLDEDDEEEDELFEASFLLFPSEPGDLLNGCVRCSDLWLW
jgi:hypothetical protein